MSRILDFADGVESNVTPETTILPAVNVSVTPAGSISSTNAQAALQEISSDVDALYDQKAEANGIATLDAQGKIPLTQIPATAITSVFVVADIAARDLLEVEMGDVAKVLDDGSGNVATYIYTGTTWEILQSDAALQIHADDTSTHGVAGDIVGTSDAQILSNKDFDGGTASNTSRLTVPKNTKSNLDSLTRKEATIVYATDEAKAYIDNGSTLIPVGSGSGGGLNYIENGDAELTSPAPSLYADSGSSPTDGSGGSVNTSTELNFSRSTSSPLRGSASWVFDKKSGNQQGKGGSFPFTIDVADKGKQVQITFDYSVLSGTYATGDVAVYVVHDPSGTPKVIQPSAFNIENVGIESLARLTFQTEYSSVLDYNLCFHVASTSASAYSLKFDNITLGPQVVPMGAPVTGWVSFTPLWQSNGTAPALGNGSVAGRWRQVGGAADIEIRLSLGSTSTTGTGTSFITWPSFMNLQPLNGSFSEGTCFMYTNNTATSRSGTPQFYTTERRFGVYLNEVGQWGGGATDWGGAGDTITITVRGVPVVGWESSTVVSSSADTRVVAGSNGKTSAQAITATTYGTAQKVTYNTTPWLDTHGMWDSSNNRWVVKVPGKYRISAPLAYQATTSEVQGIAMLRHNTSDIHQVYLAKSASTSSLAATATLEAIVDCKAGDYFEVFTYHPVPAGSLDILANASVSQVRFMIEMLQGPSQIAASEVIAAIYRNCTTTVAASGSLTTLNFTDKVQDTHNAVTTGADWTFTAPAPGFYMIQGYCQGAAESYTIGSNFVFDLTVNGVDQVIRLGRYTVERTSTLAPFATLSGGVYLNAGSTLKIKAAHSESGTRTMQSGAMFNQISIYRLGGVM